MGLLDMVKGQFIDVIEFVDDSPNKLLVYKYIRSRDEALQGHNRPTDEIKQGAQLIVRNGQAAVFVYRGEIADIFEPGNYKLDTHNLPLLSKLGAIPYALNSPIKSDLYFINTTQFIDNKWETKNPIIKRDPEIGMVRINARGTYSFRVYDAKLFMDEIFGARRMNLTVDIINYLTSFVGEAVAQCLGEMDESILDLATHYRELSDAITSYVSEKTKSLGIEVPQAAIENISLPAEVEKLIDEQSGIGLASRDMDSFVQYQSARAIRDAAKQPGGLAGMGAGLAVGRSVAENMDSSLGKKADNKKTAENVSVEGSASVADTLAKYKELLDAGALTQEEYDDVKASLLKKI